MAGVGERCHIDCEHAGAWHPDSAGFGVGRTRCRSSSLSRLIAYSESWFRNTVQFSRQSALVPLHHFRYDEAMSKIDWSYHRKG